MNQDLAWDLMTIGSGEDEANILKEFLLKPTNTQKFQFTCGQRLGQGFRFPFSFSRRMLIRLITLIRFKKSGFFESADGRFGSRQWYLVQGGARCHTSFRSLNALFELCNVFPEWPPNSPDLNPIESLWGAIK
jgi:hypothetical protein